ncbi:hypothetical protein K435DRAFT_818540 [Dendrothele bispora CBS 962.96]|uniref:HAT C-terminal dimerisation domain-containing protein n=1 Tax=Dendrothele bispora (strain CBS 962.96) TaxID=1314807 RepID=A0A4S8MAW5_DENBC|nr:hypothetical protein K435DRAFT_818540 [Dendrothele bispora CBS 962.96]
MFFEVIEYMDTVNSILEQWVRDQGKPAVIYYSKTDDSIMYQAAMLLHLQHKLSYFQKASWPEEWIDTAKDVVHNLWKTYYKPKDLMPAAVNEEQVTNDNDPFAKIKKKVVSVSGDVLEDWMASPSIDSDASEKPLQWWVEDYLKCCGWSKELQQMAMDILSCPGFSRGGPMATKQRYRLGDNLIKASTIFLFWGKALGLLPEALIARVFSNKRKQIGSCMTVERAVSESSVKEGP